MAKHDKYAESRKKTGMGILFFLFPGFLILILPLIRLGSAQDAVLMPRLLALSIFLFLFTATFFFLKTELQGSFTIFRNPVFHLLALYWVMVIISAVSALNPNEGYFDIVRSFVFLILVVYWAQFISATKEWFATLSKLVTISAIIALLIGFYQYFTQVAGNPSPRMADGRELLYAVEGLMAHKNLFSSYLMLMMPFLVFGSMKFRGVWRITAIITATLVTVLIVLLATRAVWAGMMVSSAVAVLLVIIFHKKLEIPLKRTFKFALFSFIAAMVIASLIVAGGGSKGSYLEKLGSIVRPESSNNHFRLDMWKITAEMALDHPVTGVGAGNWQIAIPAYYSQINLKGKEVNWQTPHNDFLWIASEKGIPGLLLFLGLIALVTIYMLRIIRGQSKLENKIQAILLFAGLVVYLTDSFFDFPYQRIDQQVYFSLFLTGIVALYQQQRSIKPLKPNRYIVGSLIAVVLLCCVVYSYKAVYMETQVKKAIGLTKQGIQPQAIAAINNSETVFRNLDALGSPASYYSGLAYSNHNEDQKAIPCYLKALSQHPNHVALLSNTGLSYLRTGDTAVAIQYFLKALQIVPDYKEALVNLATIYYLKRDYQGSLKMLQGVKKKKKQPEIRQNIRALNKLLGFPEDSLVKEKKHIHKIHNKDKKKKAGIL